MGAVAPRIRIFGADSIVLLVVRYCGRGLWRGNGEAKDFLHSKCSGSCGHYGIVFWIDRALAISVHLVILLWIPRRTIRTENTCTYTLHVSHGRTAEHSSSLALKLSIQRESSVAAHLYLSALVLLTYLPVIYTGFSETSARLFMNITTLLIFMNFFDIYTLMRVSFLCYAQNGSFAWVIVE